MNDLTNNLPILSTIRYEDEEHNLSVADLIAPSVFIAYSLGIAAQQDKNRAEWHFVHKYTKNILNNPLIIDYCNFIKIIPCDTKVDRAKVIREGTRTVKENKANQFIEDLFRLEAAICKQKERMYSSTEQFKLLNLLQDLVNNISKLYLEITRPYAKSTIHTRVVGLDLFTNTKIYKGFPQP